MVVLRGRFTQLYLHLVWSTWDRLPLLGRDVRPRVFAAIHAECDRLRAIPIAIGGVDDHVHVLVRFPTTVTVARLVQQLKGSTSHLINHTGPGRDRLRWQGGYGAFTVARRDVPMVARYVLNQEQHHARGRLSAPLERSPRH